MARLSSDSDGTSTAQGPAGAWGKPTLRHLLTETDRFVTMVELVTSRGLVAEPGGRRVLRLGRELAENPRIDGLSLTDNPGGSAMLAADTLGTDLLARGQEVIIHLACKDWNRNALQSRGWKLSSEGFNNVLAMSGDYPVGGYYGMAGPVFDMDSVGLLRMLSDMNVGRLPGPSGESGEKTSFFLGAVVTNHKRYESEVVPQYLKLTRKIENGAVFVINQIGYHARKDDELLRWLSLKGLRVPVIANVYVLSAKAARFFHAGNVPGVVVTDELCALAEQQAGSPDNGRSFFFELAAKQIAIAKGLGFRGAYLGGHLAASDYDEILDRADRYGPSDWRSLIRDVRFPYPDEFHYFDEDPQTGGSSSAVSRADGRAEGRERSPARRRRSHRPPLAYSLNRLVHDAVFKPGGRLYGLAWAVYRQADRAPRVERMLHGTERVVKTALFDCHDCGDCSLPEIAFLCPESQCVKNQRNGPCGGTREGLCEIGEKECIWARAYERLKARGEEETMLAGPAVIQDNALRRTSAWANALLTRDHRAAQSLSHTSPEDGQRGDVE
ncbi:MAG: methylenetetrahydrofolate reductase C-terminal domain-containing protein [Actinomycetia bacterium]|nr:methylenetetrahydrofolate reductase C-terminal domain-containing protein [Actinomycetes bacterium]